MALTLAEIQSRYQQLLQKSAQEAEVFLDECLAENPSLDGDIKTLRAQHNELLQQQERVVHQIQDVLSSGQSLRALLDPQIVAKQVSLFDAYHNEIKEPIIAQTDSSPKTVDESKLKNTAAIHFQKNDDFQDFSQQLQQTLARFADLGFSVKEKEIMKRGAESDTLVLDMCFFSMAWPRSYRGNRHILTMTAEDIKQAKECLEKNPEPLDVDVYYMGYSKNKTLLLDEINAVKKEHKEPSPSPQVIGSNAMQKTADLFASQS